MTISDEMIAHVAGEPIFRQQKFAQAREVYEANMRPPLQGETATLDNIIIPAARNIVDEGVSFLFGEDLDFDVSDAYGEDAQQYLERLWRTNRMPTKLLEIGLHGGITGAFVFKFEPDAKDVVNGDHRWVVVDPCYMDVMWDPHDTETVLLYRFEYPTVEVGDDGKLQPFVWRQDIEANRSEPNQHGRRIITSWTITNSRAKAPMEHGGLVRRWFATRTLAARFEPVGEPLHWDHAWAPVFAGQNLVSPNSWWGYSDIEAGVIRLIESLNRVASNIAKTIRHHGHPTTIVRGGELPADVVIGEPIEFDAPPADIDVANLEMQSDLKASQEFLATLRGEVYDAGNTPDVARGKVENVGQLSGAAMRILYGPLLGVNGKKRRTYGDKIEHALWCALAYAGFTPQDGADGDVHIVWPDPLPKNEKEDAEVAEIDKRLGASTETLLTRRGYDADVEAENRLEEGSNDPAMRGILDLIPNAQPGTPPSAAPDSQAPMVTDASAVAGA